MVFRLGLTWLLLVSASGAAELRLRINPRWGQAALSVPSAEFATAAGQSVRVTRLSALLSDFQLQRADGSVVRLEGQYGFIDAASGRLEVSLADIPAGKYTGLQLSIGVGPYANHADPGQWSAGQALNPLVNKLHWNWQGGYVFLALEGFWQNSPGTSPAGFSYHLATDAALMTVRFLTKFEIKDVTRVDLALDIAAFFKERKISAEDGSDTTHSGAHDALASQLVKVTQRAMFWLDAAPLRAAEPYVAAVPVVAAPVGTPLAFIVPAGFPQPMLPADNALTHEGVALGRQLFFDRRLSGNDRQSCASCHDPRQAMSDRVALSRGAEGQLGHRNAMPLFNLAWHPAYAWDAAQPTIRAQALAAMTNPIEMNAELADVEAKLADDPQVGHDFAAAFGSPQITRDRIGRALEQFLLTLVSVDARFDRAARGGAPLTAQENRGLELFLTEYDPVRGKRGGDCFHCHGGGLFSDFAVRSNGLDRVATDAGAKLTTGRSDDHGRFKTPSLRNVELTAPYMHDGRFKTLEAVLAHYDHGVKRPANLDPNLAKHPAAGMQLSAADQAALVAFLRTLTDSSFAGRASRDAPQVAP